MNDPHAQKRLELCDKQNKIHTENCVGCSKLAEYTHQMGARADQCRFCEVGKQLKEIGNEFMKYSRPRKKAKYTSDKGYEPRPKRAVPMFLGLDRIPEYIKLRKKGLQATVIAKEMNMSMNTLKNFVSKHNLALKNLKG